VVITSSLGITSSTGGGESDVERFKTKTSQAIDLSAWIAGNPVDVLATNFGRPASLFEKFPRKDVFISPNQ
jgi:hypothetical protein